MFLSYLEQLSSETEKSLKISSKMEMAKCLTTWITSLLAILFSCYLYRAKLSLQQDLDSLLASNMNNSRNGDPDALVFVRVPKTGSQKLWGMLDKLAFVNNFSSYADNIEHKRRRGGENTFIADKASRATYARVWRDNCSRPFSYSKHVHFLDAFADTDGVVANPMYVSMVRDPLERIFSWYYYRRSLAHVLETLDDDNVIISPRGPSIRELKMSFESCVENNECKFEKGQNLYGNHVMPHISQIAFFCGHHEFCMIFGDPQALQKAKMNVEKHFVVVGVLEYLEHSLTAMENFLPRYFRNASVLHYSDKKKANGAVVNGNSVKPKVDEELRMKLRANFSTEIDFYEFCKLRLARQIASINGA